MYDAPYYALTKRKKPVIAKPVAALPREQAEPYELSVTPDNVSPSRRAAKAKAGQTGILPLPRGLATPSLGRMIHAAVDICRAGIGLLRLQRTSLC